MTPFVPKTALASALAALALGCTAIAGQADSGDGPLGGARRDDQPGLLTSKGGRD